MGNPLAALGAEKGGSSPTPKGAQGLASTHGGVSNPMSAPKPTCHPVAVRNELRALVAVTVLMLPTVIVATYAGPDEAGQAAERSIVPPDAPSVVRLVIPRYVLTSDERQTVAACLVLEAASQGDVGLRGVMAVIRNRSRALPELFAPTVLRPRQFSALNRVTGGHESLAQAIHRAQRDATWKRALEIVDEAARQDAWHDPTGGATHFTRSDERTYWTRRLAKTVTLGAHSFYR